MDLQSINKQIKDCTKECIIAKSRFYYLCSLNLVETDNDLLEAFTHYEQLLERNITLNKEKCNILEKYTI